MPNTYAVVEINLDAPYEHTHLHVIHMPAFREPGYYIQGVSFDAFPKRNRDMKARRLYHAVRWDEFKETMDRIKANPAVADLDDRLLPRTDYSDIWSFYRAIGWDYKRKRFAKPKTPWWRLRKQYGAIPSVG
jgi:hypothetical protein